MEITCTKEVQALLIESHELNVPHYGLHTVAKYEVKSLPFIYTVEFWSKHAPVSILADIATVKIAGDAPMIVTDGHGHLLRDEDGKVKVTRTVTVMCPKFLDCKNAEGRHCIIMGIHQNKLLNDTLIAS